uniref:Ankyrin-1-like n=1 Tax=Crassostrea virginica TaxID=6565 RepID=A0A8B8DMH3_CRAVI|nr:ankyrin-1-like [Crassostrea virginica]
MFVFNDPIGKESFDEMLYHAWGHYRETLGLLLKHAKLLLTCRKSVFSDERAKRLFTKEGKTIDIEQNQIKLSKQEKELMIAKHFKEQPREDKIIELLEIDIYFPLLCKMWSRFSKNEKNNITFFNEPAKVLTYEIYNYKDKDKKKYCALVCLVLFNGELRLRDLKENNKRFTTALLACELSRDTLPSTIFTELKALDGLLVKQIGNTYNFYHDFVMEVTTYVIGREHPEETVKFADISFLRKRVRLENNNPNEQFTIMINDDNIDDLVNRLFDELLGDKFIEVVLNPCLQEERIRNGLMTKFKNDQEKLEMMIKVKPKNIKYDDTFTNIRNMTEQWYSRLDFVSSGTALSPLFALIAFQHDTLSCFCLNELKQRKCDLKNRYLFAASCCNGKMDLTEIFTKDLISQNITEEWGNMYPVHIASLFHNYNLLNDIGRNIKDVNIFTTDEDPLTPLLLASANNSEDEINCRMGELAAHRRDETVKLLIQMGADVNLCEEHGAGPLYIACQNGHESTAQLLLNNGADVNLCMEDGAGPLFIACQNGHESTAQLLLNNGADVNLCKNGAGPLYIACQMGNEGTVQLLLHNGADVNLCREDGAGPLYIACQMGHEGTVQLLLHNGADVNLCMEDGSGPLYIACQMGHEGTVQLLLHNGADVNLCIEGGAGPLYIACQMGHEGTVQLLLNNGADVNLCMEDGSTPLCIACQNGHESTAQILLNNGADVNLCEEDGAGPLFIACQNGNESTVQLLLNNGADVNLCMEDGAGPLFIACQNGHESTAQLLLNNGADVNLCRKNGAGPLYIACENGHEGTAQLLLNNGADVNLCMEDGSTPLCIACQNGHESTAQILLNNGADVNLCEEDGAGPLFIACQNGHESTVQLLLNNGADVKLCMEDGSTPLCIACQNGHESTAQILLNNGADVNLCEEHGAGPLYIACQNGHKSTAQLLLKNSADVNLCMEDGAGPLFIACENGHESTAQLL